MYIYIHVILYVYISALFSILFIGCILYIVSIKKMRIIKIERDQAHMELKQLENGKKMCLGGAVS